MQPRNAGLARRYARSHSPVEALEARVLLSAYLVKDINPGPPGSSPAELVDVNGRLFFEAIVAGDLELWSSDGTAVGTDRITSVAAEDSLVYALPTAFQGSVYFGNGKAIWKTSGAPGDATKVVAVPGFLRDFYPVGGLLYFTVTGSPGQWTLWRTDGTAAGTRQITTAGLSPSNLMNFNGTLIFEAAVGNRQQLWRSDGTDAGTAPFTNLPVSSAATQNEYSDEMLAVAAIVGNTLYFEDTQFWVVYLGNNMATGRGVNDLWKTDGTTTTHLAALNGYATDLQFLNGHLLATGAGVLSFDPTSWDSTTLFASGAATSPQAIKGDKLYFVSGPALWVTDGTVAGTHLIDYTGTGKLSNPIVLGGQVFFQSDAGNSLEQPWVSDGTAAGTGLVADIYSDNISYPSGPTLSGNRIYLSADDRTHGLELWAIDLTGAVSGFVFNDANNDGVPDSEAGLAGATVFVDINNNGVLDPGEPSVATDASGRYLFSGLPAGNYAIRQIPPAGFRRTTPPSPGASTSVPEVRTAVGPTFGDVQVSTILMNFDYLLTLAQHYNQPGTFAIGDLNGDDTVSFSDLLLLAQNYGHALPSSSTAAASADSANLLLRKIARKR